MFRRPTRRYYVADAADFPRPARNECHGVDSFQVEERRSREPRRPSRACFAQARVL